MKEKNSECETKHQCYKLKDMGEKVAGLVDEIEEMDTPVEKIQVKSEKNKGTKCSLNLRH